MKKFYTFAAAMLVAGSVFAQRQTSTLRTFENASIAMPSAQAEAAIDTLAPVVTCAQPGLFLQGAQGGGYVAGTNSYGDLEKGTLMFPAQAYNITDVLVLFGAKEAVSNGNFVAYIYPVDTAAGTIGNAMGTSDPVSIANIDTTLQFTEFSFSTPVSTNGPFLVSVEVDNGGDTVGIVHTNNNCGGGTAWEKWDDGSWNSLLSAWGLDVQLYIFARVDDNVSIEENGLVNASTVRAFPNPANDIVNLTYLLNDNADVTINVMDIQGRMVKTMKEAQTAGGQFVELNVSDLSAGTYFYSVQSGAQTLNGKFIVRH